MHPEPDAPRGTPPAFVAELCSDRGDLTLHQRNPTPGRARLFRFPCVGVLCLVCGLFPVVSGQALKAKFAYLLAAEVAEYSAKKDMGARLRCPKKCYRGTDQLPWSTKQSQRSKSSFTPHSFKPHLQDYLSVSVSVLWLQVPKANSATKTANGYRRAWGCCARTQGVLPRVDRRTKLHAEAFSPGLHSDSPWPAAVPGGKAFKSCRKKNPAIALKWCFPFPNCLPVQSPFSLPFMCFRLTVWQGILGVSENRGP